MQREKLLSRGNMATNFTGHAEIDQQHELLDSTVGQLELFCSEAKHNPNTTCDGCNAFKQKHCSLALASIASDLAGFLAGHAAYEEKMMELLPDTPICQQHVKAHKSAHQGIVKQLNKLSLQVVNESPRDVSVLMRQIIGGWLGDHSTSFDTRLVRLGKFDSTEIDFDGELVTMLDEYVFPNRPTKSKVSLKANFELQGKKLEARGRFESLSPAQRQVFWLVASGKKNSEISNILSVSINTIKTHRAAIFHKMDVKSALELVKKADVLR
jgi:DNA-binding CsgD family transcriptional regulator/hemerythrin